MPIQRMPGRILQHSLLVPTALACIGLPGLAGCDVMTNRYGTPDDGIVRSVTERYDGARVASPEYLDYLHLAKMRSGWKIVNVLFHTRD